MYYNCCSYSVAREQTSIRYSVKQSANLVSTKTKLKPASTRAKILALVPNLGKQFLLEVTCKQNILGMFFRSSIMVVKLNIHRRSVFTFPIFIYAITYSTSFDGLTHFLSLEEFRKVTGIKEWFILPNEVTDIETVTLRIQKFSWKVVIGKKSILSKAALFPNVQDKYFNFRYKMHQVLVTLRTTHLSKKQTKKICFQCMHEKQSPISKLHRTVPVLYFYMR